MVELAEIALRANLEDASRAPELARQVVFSLCETMGGSVVYLPRGSALKRAMRDAEIFQDWRENNTDPTTLARKHRLASQTIYEIIARQRALHRRQEPDLFGFDQGTTH
jgi:Mor family transcriptional regulator